MGPGAGRDQSFESLREDRELREIVAAAVRAG